MAESAAILSGYQVLKVLGRGGEGTVYAARNKATGDKLVLKVFYKPVSPGISEGLRLYADRVGPNEYGLSEIELLYDSDLIVALVYPFVKLVPVHQRCVNYFEHVAQALFGAYCRMQAFLMSQHKIGITDTLASHFLLARDGRFHFIDYGINIESIAHRWSLERGLFGYGFAWMLSSIYNVNLQFEVQRTPGYSYTAPCAYCMAESLDIVAARHSWVGEVLSEVRSHHASILLDPEFYWRQGQRFPDRVRFPWLVSGVGSSLFYAGKLRDMCVASAPGKA